MTEIQKEFNKYLSYCAKNERKPVDFQEFIEEARKYVQEPETETPKNYFERQEKMNFAIKEFWNEWIKDDDTKITFTSVYEEYCDDCKQKENEILSKKSFAVRSNPIVGKTKRFRLCGEIVCGYRLRRKER